MLLKNYLSTEKSVKKHVHTATVGQTCTAEIALMSLQVKVAGAKRVKSVKVLLDNGSQNSYISESLEVELGLRTVSKERTTHTQFGG